MNYVILGNGPAALQAVQSIRKLDPSGSIQLVTREKLPAYSPCLLAELLSRKLQPNRLHFVKADFYEKHRVQVFDEEKAIRLDRNRKRVTTDRNREIPFDKLLIAIGAIPSLPPVPGTGLGNVFTLKTLRDVEAIQQAAADVRSAIVIGTGFVALEAAQALAEMKKKVAVLARRWVLPRMLNEDIAKPVEENLVDHGVEVLLKANFQSINGHQGVSSITVNDREWPCQMVVLATGLNPDIEMARKAGLQVNWGIVVDQRMQTSDPDIFAAGDVAEGIDMFGTRQVLANWPNATRGGKTAGENMGGQSTANSGLEAINVLRIFGQQICSLGLTDTSDVLDVKQHRLWKKYFLKNNRVIGMQSVGSAFKAGLVLSLIKKKLDVRDLIPVLQSDQLHYGHLMP